MKSIEKQSTSSDVIRAAPKGREPLYAKIVREDIIKDIMSETYKKADPQRCSDFMKKKKK